MVEQSRVKRLNAHDLTSGEYVLYWMQQSQRTRFNHALEYAIEQSNARALPVVAVFALSRAFPEANARHYQFMLEGLACAELDLARRGIQLVVLAEEPPRAIERLGGRAALVVTDRGYLRIQKRWREEAARRLKSSLIEVESDVVVPVDLASDKQEFAARTLRPKIHRLLDQFLIPLRHSRPRQSSLGMRLGGVKLSPPSHVIRSLRISRAAQPVTGLHGGEMEARRMLDQFTGFKLQRYTSDRSEASIDATSRLSAFLHFGHISPLEIALAVREQPHDRNAEAFLEQLIVRRELSMNFVQHNKDYDRYECLPAWARTTLEEHARDPRPYIYSLEQLEDGATHDPYWNAAQHEMLAMGTMHNTMRMYWGKKLIEWTRRPWEAFEIALYLNNKYQLDGRDPNSFAGVAWCFGLHDRPWSRRPIFGTVRYMNASGLDRKYRMGEYIARRGAEPKSS